MRYTIGVSVQYEDSGKNTDGYYSHGSYGTRLIITPERPKNGSVRLPVFNNNKDAETVCQHLSKKYRKQAKELKRKYKFYPIKIDQCP